MDSNYKSYDYLASIARIDDYLTQPSGNFVEVDELPYRNRLTYTNGFYARWCSAMFVDIRDSSKLPDFYKRPVLAKIYRAYISEVVAILNAVETAREINIVGDGVWAVFSTRYTRDNDAIFSAACRVNSLIAILNLKMKRAGYTTPIRVGVGLSDGRALMIKAGYNGSGIADVVYMGQVVNRAAKLASEGSKDGNDPIIIDDAFANWLNDENQRLLRRNALKGWLSSSAVNVAMDKWATESS